MNNPCANRVICEDGGDFPLANYSSEAPEDFLYYGQRRPVIPPPDPLGGTPTFTAGCLSQCVSTVSQDDADLCAARTAFLCAYYGGGSGTGRTGPFYSNAAVFTIACGGGSVFTWQVPAGAFVNVTQAAADAQAEAYAITQAARFAYCLSEIVADGVVGTPYASTIVPTGGRFPFSLAVVLGALPDGLTLTNEGTSATITGTPTKAGTFTFTVQCVDGLSVLVTKQYTITITGADCTELKTLLEAQWLTGCQISILPGGICAADYTGGVFTFTGAGAGSNTGLFVSDYAQGYTVDFTTVECKCRLAVQVNSFTNGTDLGLHLTVQDTNTAIPFLQVDVPLTLGVTNYDFTVPAGVQVTVQWAVTLHDTPSPASFDVQMQLGNP